MYKYRVRKKRLGRNGKLSQLKCENEITRKCDWQDREDVIRAILNGNVYIVPRPDTELRVCLSTDPDGVESNNLNQVEID